MSQSPRHGASFASLWVGHLISNIGTGLTGFAVGVWLFERGAERATELSLFIFALQLPGLLLLPLAGTLADRASRLRLMVISFVGGSASTLAALFFLETGLLAKWNVMLCAMATYLFLALLSPAYVSAISSLLPARLYGRAGGLTQLGLGIALVAVPVLGTILLPTIGMRGILLIDLATFGIAIGLLGTVRIPAIASAHPARSGAAALWGEAGEGFRYLAGRPGLCCVFLLFGVRNVFFGIGQVVFLPFLVLAHSEYGLAVLGAAGLGMVVGAGALSLRKGTGGVVRKIIVAELLLGASLSALGWSVHLAWLGAFLFLVFFALPLSGAWSQVLVQQQVELPMQGRVIALLRMLQRATIPLGTLAAGPLADQVFVPLLRSGDGGGAIAGYRCLLGVIGGLSVAATLVVVALPSVRRLEDESSPVEPLR